jgi:N6-adenosine-specific RNA methylase IME4
VRFKVLLADPPWEFPCWSPKGGKKGGEAHYATESPEWIASLPVGDVADKDAVLLLWAVCRDLPAAFAVMAAWGFEYKTMLTWVKMSRAAAPRIGCGYHVRNCTEQLLIGTRGAARAPTTDRRPPDVFFNPPAAHSVKPARQYEIAEGYAGPYLELFARNRWPGWVSIGNELDGLDIRESLRRLAADEPLPRLPLAQPALDWQAQP